MASQLEDTMKGARCVALTQEHRGHGVSTTAYYLARVLVSEGLRVLLVDLTGRRTRLHSLTTRGPVKNLGFYAPQAVPRPQDVGALLDQIRRQTQGKVDVLLVDADCALLERAGGLSAGMDYVVTVVTPTPTGQASADHIAEALGDEQPPFGRVGVIFSRVNAAEAGELPERTDGRGLPIIGHFPADYLLAAGDDYSLKGGEQSWPHDKYLYALLRLGRALIRIVPLNRVSSGGAAVAGQTQSSDSHPQA